MDPSDQPRLPNVASLRSRFEQRPAGAPPPAQPPAQAPAPGPPPVPTSSKPILPARPSVVPASPLVGARPSTDIDRPNGFLHPNHTGRGSTSSSSVSPSRSMPPPPPPPTARRANSPGNTTGQPEPTYAAHEAHTAPRPVATQLSGRQRWGIPADKPTTSYAYPEYPQPTFHQSFDSGAAPPVNRDGKPNLPPTRARPLSQYDAHLRPPPAHPAQARQSEDLGTRSSPFSHTEHGQDPKATRGGMMGKLMPGKLFRPRSGSGTGSGSKTGLINSLTGLALTGAPPKNAAAPQSSTAAGRIISTRGSAADPQRALTQNNDFPDISQVASASINPSPIFYVEHKPPSKLVAVSGNTVCSTGLYTNAWDMVRGNLISSIRHDDTMGRISAMVFCDSTDLMSNNRTVWLGSSKGVIYEYALHSASILDERRGYHGQDSIEAMHHIGNNIWTIDSSGRARIWAPPPNEGCSRLTGKPGSCNLLKGHLFSLPLGEDLWYATAEGLMVYSWNSSSSSLIKRTKKPLVCDRAGKITSGCILQSDPSTVYFSHSDGRVSMYDRKDYVLIRSVLVTRYRIYSMTGVGDLLWLGLSSPKIQVYDTKGPQWVLRQEIVVGTGTGVVSLLGSTRIIEQSDRGLNRAPERYIRVFSLFDSRIQVWNGLLKGAWAARQKLLPSLNKSDIKPLTVLIGSWNAGAVTPRDPNFDGEDFVESILGIADTKRQHGNNYTLPTPDIIIFGFQELVDLESKKETAKFLVQNQSELGSAHLAWQIYLQRRLERIYGENAYVEVPDGQIQLFGLFMSVFVKSSVMSRLSVFHTQTMKLGMRGLHGNKGAVCCRMIIDGTSLCFVNCHLAAGQDHKEDRHSHLSQIVKTLTFQVPEKGFNSFVNGGDGSSFMDHELCFINGDMNYRIDSMTRTGMVRHIKENNLHLLLPLDQLRATIRRDPDFIGRAFDEGDLTFAPTYKYDVGTDVYDTSDKARLPAWCDRVLFRSVPRGKIEQLLYRRHDNIRASDHRPVSSLYRVECKTVISSRNLDQAWAQYTEEVWAAMGIDLYHLDLANQAQEKPQPPPPPPSRLFRRG